MGAAIPTGADRIPRPAAWVRPPPPWPVAVFFVAWEGPLRLRFDPSILLAVSEYQVKVLVESEHRPNEFPGVPRVDADAPLEVGLELGGPLPSLHGLSCGHNSALKFF